MKFDNCFKLYTALVCIYLLTEIFCRHSRLSTFLRIKEGYVSACSGHVPLDFGLAAQNHKRNIQKVVFCAYLTTHLNSSLFSLRKCDNLFYSILV